MLSGRYFLGVLDESHIPQQYSYLVLAFCGNAVVEINKKQAFLAIDVANSTVAAVVDLIIVVKGKAGDLQFKWRELVHAEDFHKIGDHRHFILSGF